VVFLEFERKMKKREGWRKRESRHCSHYTVSVEELFQVRKLPRNEKKKKSHMLNGSSCFP